LEGNRGLGKRIILERKSPHQLRSVKLGRVRPKKKRLWEGENPKNPPRGNTECLTEGPGRHQGPWLSIGRELTGDLKKNQGEKGKQLAKVDSSEMEARIESQTIQRRTRKQSLKGRTDEKLAEEVKLTKKKFCKR